MPKISRIDSLPVHKKNNANLSIKKINSTSLTIDNGMHIINNLNTNSVTKLTLNSVDKLSPVINKFPNVGKIIIFTCEKIIRISGKI